jgi:hypothetical protein
MFEADLTHEGDRCNFKVLAQKLNLKSQSLCALAERSLHRISKTAEVKTSRATSELQGVTGAKPSRPDEIPFGARVFLSCPHRSARPY